MNTKNSIRWLRVLSLFDGCSCWRVALERAWIKVSAYYASEIDKSAIAVTKANYPNTIQLGDIKQLSESNLPKDIDLVIWWSPCQGFSIAGKKLYFKDERSSLLFEYIRVLKIVKPKYFLYENVIMKKEYIDIISKLLWVKPVTINSSLFLSQNRDRLYWSNIPINSNKLNELKSTQQSFIKNLKQPIHTIEDILEDSNQIDSWYFFKWSSREDTIKNFKLKDNPIMTNLWLKEIAKVHLSSFKSSNRVYSIKGVSPTLVTKCWDLYGTKILVKKQLRWKGAIVKDNWVYKKLELQQVRRFTPIEVERLQWLPDDYTKVNWVSRTQRYRMVGNGWSVDVVAFLFEGLKED
jgi:DNA-cytosine methyltransferase